MIELIPAIDIIDGQCVRLKRGDYNAKTVYSSDPVEVAKEFERLGFREADKRTLMYKLYTGCINCSKHENPFTCPEHAMVLSVGRPDAETPSAAPPFPAS